MNPIPTPPTSTAAAAARHASDVPDPSCAIPVTTFVREASRAHPDPGRLLRAIPVLLARARIRSPRQAQLGGLRLRQRLWVVRGQAQRVGRCLLRRLADSGLDDVVGRGLDITARPAGGA